MLIYLDENYRCHCENDGTMREIDAAFFDGKCRAFIEAYRYVPKGESWKRADGEVFAGEMISPWRSSIYPEELQKQYELQLELAKAAYMEGVNSI